MFIKSIIFLLLILFTRKIWSERNIQSKQDHCLLKHNGQNLTEGDITEINGKMYKVEDCELHRAYHVCGTHIIIIINIVCEAIEQHKPTSHKKRYSRFVQQKLLTEACCQHLCTVSEMTRYCPD